MLYNESKHNVLALVGKANKKLVACKVQSELTHTQVSWFDFCFKSQNRLMKIVFDDGLFSNL